MIRSKSSSWRLYEYAMLLLEQNSTYGFKRAFGTKKKLAPISDQTPIQRHYFFDTETTAALNYAYQIPLSGL